MPTTRQLVVEVIDARNLLPKDGHGASSPYAVLDFHGQRRKTRTVARDLNPAWNQTLEFNAAKASDILGDTLEVDVFHDKSIGPTTRNNFLGRVRLNSGQFVKKGEEALIYYPLEKKNLFSWIQGDIGLKIYFADVDTAPPPPPPPPAEKVPPPEKPDDAESKPLSEAATVPDENPTAESDKSGSSDGEAAPLVDQVMASVSPGYIPEVKVNSVKPISRVSSVSSFVSSEQSYERSSFDLVEKMHYLFVRVVKARSLPTAGSPVVKISVSGRQVVSGPARKTNFFDWDQTFAFPADSSTILEVSVWDGGAGGDFLGGVCFDAAEIPLRDPPDSPLAPQWYRLEGGGAHRGDLMLATWTGTQTDESFPEVVGNLNSKSKVYQSPKLWYLRSTIIEAQDVGTPKESSYQVKVQLGFQVQKTKQVSSTTGAVSWNEDLMFVAAEPFSDQNLIVFLTENLSPKEEVIVAVARIPLSSIERRVDDRNVMSRWSTLENPNEENRGYRGRVHIKLCFDGGYHVMDEAANVCSDYRPTARQLWKPHVGVIELGIIGCKSLIPMKTITGKASTTDAYAVAKYGEKWVRTRTVSDSLDPRWNEQYTWRVYDPSTVLTVGVFDNDSDGNTKESKRIGKVRIRVSALETGKVYRTVFPLFLLSKTGLKKMGEIELAIRFTRATPTLDFLHVYFQPLLPVMHQLRPLGKMQREVLRSAAVRIISAHLLRSEPPLRREVVTYILDSDSNAFSMRKVRANWMRIINVIAGVIDVIKWVDETRSWRNPTSTMLVHVLLVMFVWFPELIVPTISFYVFAVGAWNYRLRPKGSLPGFDTKVSLAEASDREEFDEEFDGMPCARSNEVVRGRYDKMRVLGARVQVLLGDFATQGERVQAVVTWQDPRATGMFVGLCLAVAFVLYLVPTKMVAVAFGFYYFRHPVFRDRMTSPAVNFFRRLPSMSDQML